MRLKTRLSLPKLEAPHIRTRGPRHLQFVLMHVERTDRPGPIPSNLIATLPEWYCYWALIRLGKKPNIDFTFQSSLAGGRYELGGVVLDFLIKNPPHLGINIQGVRWHYELGMGRKSRDALQRIRLEHRGIKIIFIDEDHILRDPVYYVRDALRGIDHSRAGGS